MSSSSYKNATFILYNSDVKQWEGAMRIAQIAVLCLGVSGCTQATWNKPGMSLSDLESEKAGCEYEAAKATASSGGIGLGMSTAIAAGIEEGIKRAEIQNLCMKSKGWSRG